MAVGSDGSVYITDDKSRVAKIVGATVAGMIHIDLPGGDNTPLYCYGEEPVSGQNTANNIAAMQVDDRRLVYAVSEQNTVTILNAGDLSKVATVTVPGAVHLDVIGVDPSSTRVWITDEDLNAVFVLQGSCANGTGKCGE